MSKRKPQKDLDRAIANLVQFGERPPWDDRQGQFYVQSLVRAAETMEIDPDDLKQLLEEEGYMGMAMGYLFEQFATGCWDDEDFCFVEDYLKRRGWRETPYAKRYLRALVDSDVRLWEVVEVKPGQWLDVRPYGSEAQPLRVRERSGSRNLTPWDCVAARVLTLDGSHQFSGGLLPFSPEQARNVYTLWQALIGRASEAFKDQAREEFEDLDWESLPEGSLEALTEAEASPYLADLLFAAWAGDTYFALSEPLPQLLNADGEAMLWSEVRFDLETRDTQAVQERLNSVPELNFEEKDEGWVWLDADASGMGKSGAKVLGLFTLEGNQLLAQVNSLERVDRAADYLKTLLGDWLGEIQSVNHGADILGEGDPEAPPADLPPAPPPELVTSVLDEHYRATLDQPIPALGDLTPREAARRADQRERLIAWLKDLESSAAKAPDMAYYDFAWMWRELEVDPLSGE